MKICNVEHLWQMLHVAHVYSASSLDWPLMVITFLHRLYLPKLLYVVRTFMHVAQQIATEIFTQGS